MITEFKCTCCPRGCDIRAEKDEKTGSVRVSGNRCCAGAELASKKLSARSNKMWKSLIRPAMIFIPFTLGVIFPQAHVLNDEPYNSVLYMLMLMTFISSLQVDLRELKPRREHWLLVAANIVMGLVPYCLFRLFLPDQPDMAKAAFFVGITPTATAAPVVIAFLNGRVGFALTGFTISFMCISGSLLFLLPVVTGTFTPDFIGRVALTLVKVIVIPLGSALLIRYLFPVVKTLPKKLKMFNFLLWSFN